MRAIVIATVCLVAAVCMLAGCEKKEKVLDIDTPAGGIEIEKSDNNIKIEIKSKEKDGSSVEIDIPKDTNKSP